MSTPSYPGLVTVATPQPQPTSATYGTAALTLYPQYTRASYFVATGEQPPNYDPTQPTKLWSATDADTVGWYPPGSETYTEFSAPASWKATPQAWAACVNIPGIQTFPAWVPAPTVATQLGDIGAQPDTIPPNLLSTYQQALDMAEALGMTPTQAQAAIFDQGATTVNYGSETRREWAINWPQANGAAPAQINVGLQIQLNSVNGYGSPGVWGNLTGGVGTPTWTGTAVLVAPVPNAAGPIPMRQLNTMGAANEVWVETLMALEIANSSNPAVPSGGSSSGGGLTTAQSATLSRIDANLQALMIAERLTPQT